MKNGQMSENKTKIVKYGSIKDGKPELNSKNRKKIKCSSSIKKKRSFFARTEPQVDQTQR